MQQAVRKANSAARQATSWSRHTSQCPWLTQTRHLQMCTSESSGPPQTSAAMAGLQQPTPGTQAWLPSRERPLGHQRSVPYAASLNCAKRMPVPERAHRVPCELPSTFGPPTTELTTHVRAVAALAVPAGPLDYTLAKTRKPTTGATSKCSGATARILQVSCKADRRRTECLRLVALAAKLAGPAVYPSAHSQAKPQLQKSQRCE